MPLFGGIKKKWKFWQRQRSPVQPVLRYLTPDEMLEHVESVLFPSIDIIHGADQVWPKIFIGDIHTAKNLEILRKHQFTHVLNCAHNPKGGNTVYDGMGITYMGIEAEDEPTYDMSVHFRPAAEFIHTALDEGGKILVHCHAGVSRSGTIVLAYLMIKHNMSLATAVHMVKWSRGIEPNRGFLRQLVALNYELYGNHGTDNMVC